VHGDNGHTNNKRPLWGVLGGMGPLASAEFLQTVYRLSLAEAKTEQDMARVILVSDPIVPDRTEAIAGLKQGDPQQFEEVKTRLKQLLKMLAAMQVDSIVIPCVTAHFFLPYLDLPSGISSRICSLVSVVCDALRAAEGKYILLRTNGTRETGIFENHPGWQEASQRLQPMEDADQETVHWKYLYKIKKNNISCEGLSFLQCLLSKYGAQGVVAGCTEVHLHTRQLLAHGLRVIDPLQIIAQRIAAG
jgi:aspartate racemase